MIPKGVQDHLKHIARICVENDNMIALIHRAVFVDTLYMKCKTYDDVLQNISRWDVMTVIDTRDDKLIELHDGREEAINLLYELAKESI